MSLTRRRFLGMGAAATALTIVPRHVVAGSGQTPPSEKLNIAGIGIGGQGHNDLMSVGSENIVALCDVDDRYAAKAYQQWPRASGTATFAACWKRRRTSTRSCGHAGPPALPHLDGGHQLGKHVYCEKPLTHTIAEARALAEAAGKYKVATQMGNQGNAGEGVRLIERMDRGRRHRQVARGPRLDQQAECPAGMDGQRKRRPCPPGSTGTCGLARRERPYHPAYLPFKWRGWWDFGSSSLGDMGCHVINNAVVR